MAKRTRRRRVGGLVRDLARGWTRQARSGLPPVFRAHARTAVREGLLAVASLCEEILRSAEARTGRARRRIERIAVTDRAAGRPGPRRTRLR
jgi:hypothetical protein